MASAEEEEDVGAAFLCSFFSLSSVLPLVRLLSWDRPGRRANGELATCRLRADCGRETDSVYTAMVSIGRIR